MCHVSTTSRSLKVVTARYGQPWPDQFFLDAFTKLRKQLLASSCPSVRMEQLGSQWTDFIKTGYLSIFRKSVGKMKLLLKN
jgi:hypothetical protein